MMIIYGCLNYCEVPYFILFCPSNCPRPNRFDFLIYHSMTKLKNDLELTSRDLVGIYIFKLNHSLMGYHLIKLVLLVTIKYHLFIQGSTSWYSKWLVIITYLFMCTKRSFCCQLSLCFLPLKRIKIRKKNKNKMTCIK